MKPRFALCLLALVFATLPVRSAEPRALTGHLPPAIALSQPLGRLPQNETLHLAIGLPLRNRGGLTNLLQRLYDPRSPSFHQFLTSRQFSDAFGPTEQDYQAVINFAKTNGLEILSTSSNRLVLEVQGSAANVEKAFHIHINRFQHPIEARSFYAPDVEPSVDSTLPISFIGGLNSYRIPHPSSLHTAPFVHTKNAIPNAGSQEGYYVGLDFRAAYAQGVTNTGTGQSVGLLEFDSYYQKDISDYLALSATGLSGNSVTLSNVVINRTGKPGNGNVEVALDIDMTLSMAPGLSIIYVYIAANDSASPDLIVNRMTSDNLSRQLSCSWSDFDDSTIENDFLTMATQGQTFFQASGDSGAYVGTNTVQPPTDNPNLTSVGGTTLNTSGPRGTWTSETTWNWFTSPYNGLSNSATSGGISPQWSLPAWQQGISTANNDASTSSRNLPDVALVANDLFIYADNGEQLAAGGTSAAAPLWAAMTALINQQRAAQDQPSQGFLNSSLYAIAKGANYSSCFHDTTTGNNTNLGSSTLYPATTGYDLCTGWGTPIAAGLMNALAPEPLQVTPTTGFSASGPYGGFFLGGSATFTLTNVATASFNWALGAGANWISASSTSGSLTSGGAAATVTVSLNSTANSLKTGSHSTTAWFTNVNDHVTQSAQIHLTVTKAPLTVTASNASRPYGENNPTFQGSIVGLQNGDNITAAFNCAATIDSPVGSYPITPSLVDPNNLQTNYTVSLVNGALTVGQAAVTITWPTPTAVYSGTVLGTNQLDAATGIPGTFVYNPPTGTTLNQGTNILSVTFTPTDTTDYSNATDSVSILVIAAPQLADSGDSPLMPAWGFVILLTSIAGIGAGFVSRRANSRI